MNARASIIIAALTLTAVASAHQSSVPDTLTKAALYIFNTDFVHDEPESTFTRDELEILRNQRQNLVNMINAALGHSHSVVGTDLAAYFDLEECIPTIRHQFLRPGRYYGWEGTDLNDPDAHLSDHQYVYHHRYLEALRHFYGDRLASKLKLTEYEKQLITMHAENADSESHEWALWMHEKLADSI